MNRKRNSKPNINTFVFGVDIGKEKSVATDFARDRDVKDSLEFAMNTEGYGNFASGIPKETKDSL